MICFNRGWSPDDENKNLAEKLQKLLDKIKDIESLQDLKTFSQDYEDYEIEEIHSVEESLQDLFPEDTDFDFLNGKTQDDDDDETIDLSLLLDLVYESLFLKDNNKLTITITKNPNNSLNLNIDNLE